MSRGFNSPSAVSAFGMPERHGSEGVFALGQWLTIRRVAGITGLGYVVGVSIENMEALGSPTLSSSVADIRAAYGDHALAVVTSFAGALALLAYTAFAAVLYVWFRGAGRPAEAWGA